MVNMKQMRTEGGVPQMQCILFLMDIDTFYIFVILIYLGLKIFLIFL